ncbi:hypothetical protein [Streptomyces sp. SAS_270]|uniref:hypothetical protein n=1 Tax=Streptomyces sp. SAS_270 TaxID=3412748 RepID=UPI00403CF23C
MKDNGGGHRTRWPALRETVEGARTEQQPKGLKDLVEPGFDGAYMQFGDAFPQHQLELQILYGDAQRAFEERTRQSLRITVQSVLRNVLGDQRLGDSPPNAHLANYLDREIDRIKVRLNQDGELAVSRGLNFGLGLGVVLLLVPLLTGEKLLGALGIALNCSDRWSLTGALVCGGVGAFGAVLSVLVRLRNSGDQLIRRPANGHREVAVPGQVSRSLRRGGVYRVFVGWFLAVATYFLLSAGFVTVVDIPATPADICPAHAGPATAGNGTTFWGFWCAVGFVAGFNERWVYGLLGHEAMTKQSGPRA